MSALVLRDLSVGRQGSPKVLDAINLTLGPGEKIGVIGPNGSGKSSLFLTIAGILPPLRGEIMLDDQQLAPAEIAPQIGVLLQHAEDQIFNATVAEDIAYGPRNQGLHGAELAARVVEVMKRCRVEALSERPVHHLSGGEKRRVAIAGILAMAPQVLLLDEPSAALDLRNRRALIDLLRPMPKAMLIASHDLDFVLELCTRVVLIDDGRVQAIGPTHAVLSDEALMTRHGQEVPAALHNLRPARPITPRALGSVV